MKAKTFAVYLIEHKENGNCYVGWTSQKPKNRWDKHISDAHRHDKTHIHRAINKYGQDSFNWIVINYCNSAEEAKELEIYWISRLKDFGINIYNHSEGGDGTVGYHHTDEAKQKMREFHSGKVLSEEHKKKIGDGVRGENNYWFGKTGELHYRFGTHHSDDTKRKISEGNKGKSSPIKGKKLSDEVRKNMSNAQKGRIFSDEHKKNLSNAKKGKPNIKARGRKMSDDQKKSLSDSKKGKRTWSKLSKEDVIYIRELQKNNLIGEHTISELANKYNVSVQNIHSILKYKSWKDIK